MVACRKKTTAGWVGTLTVYDGLHVRFGSMACSAGTSTRWPAGSSQSSTSAYQSLSRALRKRGGLKSVFAKEPSRPRGDFLAVVTPRNATPPQ
jgi:hypothetical protein